MTNLEWRLFVVTVVLTMLATLTYYTDKAFTQAERRDMGTEQARATEILKMSYHLMQLRKQKAKEHDAYMSTARGLCSHTDEDHAIYDRLGKTGPGCTCKVIAQALADERARVLQEVRGTGAHLRTPDLGAAITRLRALLGVPE